MPSTAVAALAPALSPAPLARTPGVTGELLRGRQAHALDAVDAAQAGDHARDLSWLVVQPISSMRRDWAGCAQRIGAAAVGLDVEPE